MRHPENQGARTKSTTKPSADPPCPACGQPKHRRRRSWALFAQAGLLLIALAQVVPDSYREQLVELVLQILRS